ncbi:GGDEF domain-containing protein [Thalassotalea piscium]|uniref:diguanylate cyclase n=1 Tax=Thalassotalea piscium TaxID=1230533 RepID=A0A7X0NK58_9GAMM|nr:GGDEF domain-containing protein [Thalassotalea piscium]MBB6544901.1 diguanylate cyclase (GGDEF)-like protein [Thalassotalea piscium]
MILLQWNGVQFKSLSNFIALVFCVFVSTQLFASEVVTTNITEVPVTLPQVYETYSYEEKVDWLKQAIDNSKSRDNIYRLTTELVFQYDLNNETELIRSTCQSLPPESKDLDYRLLCVTAHVDNDETKLKTLVVLQKDALEADNIRVAAESSSTIAWIYSSFGEIEQAFRNYEIALPLAEYANIYLFNDVTLNLATLYIVHGDSEYVEKGISLMLDAIERVNNLLLDDPSASRYVENTLARIHFNLGIANTFHRTNYPQALHYFGLIDPELTELRQSVLVFSSLAYAELNNFEESKALLAQSFQVPSSQTFNSDYLKCYQEVIKVKLDDSTEIEQCHLLSESTSVEVQQDLLKRMIDAEHAELSLIGLQKLYSLYINSLLPLLKQNSGKSASRTELTRLQQESRLKGELINKEKALTAAEQEKLASQSNLTIAIIAVFILLLLMVVLQLRQKQKLADQFAQMSLFDKLTGLNNRHYFEQNIKREMRFVKRAIEGDRYTPIAIYLFDIDHFKNVNDTYGHDVGDEVLIEFARRINEAIRDSDMFIRWGGEEFLLVARLFELDDYYAIAERVRGAISDTEFELENMLKLKVSCTIGSVIFPSSPEDDLTRPWDQLVKLADNALYMGKRQQRDCWVCVDKVIAEENFSLVLSQDLEDSIKDNLVEVTHSIKEFDRS